MNIWLLITRHETPLSMHKQSPRWNERIAVTRQSWANCWLYSMFNNMWLNLGYKISLNNIINIKRMLRDAGVDFEDLGNSERVAAAVICERWNKEFPNKKIWFFCLDFDKDAEKMGKLFLDGYSLVYTRSTKPEFQEDIRDNDVVDSVHKVWAEWHAVNLCIPKKEDPTLMEIGQRGDEHYANQFTYRDIMVFGGNIKAWSIDNHFTFLDYL